MDALKILFLGILQGIAEFLPISSSGHLVLAERFLGGMGESAALNVSLHIGSLGAILVVYHQRIRKLLSQQRILWMIVLATMPLVIIGVPLKYGFDLLEQTSLIPLVAGCGLLVTAAYMFRSQRMPPGEGTLEQITPRIALVVGVFQAVATMPGISRSGSTIFAALLLGLTRSAATDFSFLIAIPAILGATVLYSKDIIEAGDAGMGAGWLALGAFVSFAVGVVALRWLLKAIVGGSLDRFGWYCLGLGLVCITWQCVQLWG